MGSQAPELFATTLHANCEINVKKNYQLYHEIPNPLDWTLLYTESLALSSV